jgi:hypothetical protein
MLKATGNEPAVRGFGTLDAFLRLGALRIASPLRWPPVEKGHLWKKVIYECEGGAAT